MSEAPALLETRNLVKHFRLPGGWLSGDRQYVRAVDDVSLQVRAGEVLGVVGESGSGKTTLGRLLLRLEEPTQGSIAFRGQDLGKIGRQSLRSLRREMQVVFQNPFTSLDPRMRVLDVVAEPLRTHRVVPRAGLRDRVLELLERVGMGTQHLDRYPHELSGGQAQRVAIARALALIRRCSCSTSRRRPWMCRCRRRSSRCSRSGEPNRASPMCSSPTTCPWYGTSATGSR